MASILVIEDDDSFRKAICRLLSSLGYEVSAVADGKQGLKAYRSDPADIVLLDMYMPVMDGLETVTAVMRHDPKARVIAMTGGWKNTNFNVLEPALLMGARKILNKPIDAVVLKATIEEVLAMPT